METKQKLLNVARRYLVEGEKIIFINQHNEATTFKQVDCKIKISEVLYDE